MTKDANDKPSYLKLLKQSVMTTYGVYIGKNIVPPLVIGLTIPGISVLGTWIHPEGHSKLLVGENWVPNTLVIFFGITCLFLGGMLFRRAYNENSYREGLTTKALEQMCAFTSGAISLGFGMALTLWLGVLSKWWTYATFLMPEGQSPLKDPFRLFITLLITTIILAFFVHITRKENPSATLWTLVFGASYFAAGLLVLAAFLWPWLLAGIEPFLFFDSES